jgi:hypothetical protein
MVIFAAVLAATPALCSAGWRAVRQGAVGIETILDHAEAPGKQLRRGAWTVGREDS